VSHLRGLMDWGLGRLVTTDEDLAQRLGATVRTVERYRAALVEAGWWTTVRRGRNFGTEGEPSVLALTVPVCPVHHRSPSHLSGCEEENLLNVDRGFRTPDDTLGVAARHADRHAARHADRQIWRTYQRTTNNE
jgi:hypothetical protein